MNQTYVEYFGPQIGNCGYCKNKNCSKSNGMQAYCMTPEIYQDLIDRGWRRSGTYCYKPNMQTTCCPSYTIKSDVTKFQLSKSHKKILKRMQRFLKDGKRYPNEDEKGAGDNEDNVDDIHSTCSTQNNDSIQSAVHGIPKQKLDIDLSLMATKPVSSQNATNEETTQKSPAVELQKKVKSVYDPNKAPCKKAKQIRLERRQAKGAIGLPNHVKTNEAKTLADFIYTSSDTDKHKLKLVLLASKNSNVEDENFQVYFKYQTIIHKDAPNRLTPTSLSRFLYRSPIEYSDAPNCGLIHAFGSYHQQYWLDDKLIAVGVIDILPLCVSSVYFFYDPDYSFLSLGTYGSLREIEFTQQLSKLIPTLNNYYMGFYIHSCPKMRYKGQLVPSYLLCPETYTWHLLTDEVRARLDENKYQRLNPDARVKDFDEFKENDLAKILIFLYDSRTLSTLGDFLDCTDDEIDREALLEYGRLVGKTYAHRLLYIVKES